MNMEAGSIVRSLKGHDAGTYYIVLGEERERLLLADGITKTPAAPKKKNRKHVSCEGRADELAGRLLEGLSVSEEEIKRTLKLWKAYHA